MAEAELGVKDQKKNPEGRPFGVWEMNERSGVEPG
jgi:hypothetical protein